MADLPKVEHFVTGQTGHTAKLNVLVDAVNALIEENAELRAELAKPARRAPKTAATSK